MSVVLSETQPTAKKDYQCDACAWLINGGLPDGMKYSDVKKYILAKREGFKIRKGTKYIRQVGIYDGDFYCTKSRPEIHKINLKYDIYDNYV